MYVMLGTLSPLWKRHIVFRIHVCQDIDRGFVAQAEVIPFQELPFGILKAKINQANWIEKTKPPDHNVRV